MMRWRESGQVSLSGPLLTLAEEADHAFATLATRWDALPERHPVTIGPDVLARTGYLRSFPHQVSFATEQVLTPAACYHLYPAHEGEALDGPLYLTTVNTCFRRVLVTGAGGYLGGLLVGGARAGAPRRGLARSFDVSWPGALDHIDTTGITHVVHAAAVQPVTVTLDASLVRLNATTAREERRLPAVSSVPSTSRTAPAPAALFPIIGFFAGNGSTM